MAWTAGLMGRGVVAVAHRSGHHARDEHDAEGSREHGKKLPFAARHGE
jgi:hypothetical protein